MLQIPPDALSPDALAGLIDEFVTRHGTELSDATDKVEQVRQLLRTGAAIVVFDEEAESANIVPKDYKPPPPPPDDPYPPNYPRDTGADDDPAPRVEPDAPPRPRYGRPKPRVESDGERDIVYDEPPPPDLD